ncbi:hypothetical protein BgiBS90_035298 [Biomphalaria glabrata]|nr:hypothetical protein BgiBS90_035298 [Biomphalaria glabrata]
MLLLVLTLFVARAATLPAHNTSHGFSTGRLAPEDYTFIRTLPKSRAAGNLPGFKYIYVDGSGAKSYNFDPSRYQLQIAGSPLTSWEGLNAAADVVVLMTRYMPPQIFNNVAAKASVGVFTAAEKLIVYPEYAYMANTFCGSSCSGQCQQTCTFDGRKYEDIAGVGGQRAVILDDNVLCTVNDPYRGSENILAHEFTHTIHEQGLSGADKAAVHAAYTAARARQTWTLSSYAMQNEQEYFAEAATVYFGINYSNINSGGMNICAPGAFCSGEMADRYHLYQTDTALYNILTYVFTNNRPNLASGLTVCPAGHSVVG